MRPEPEVSREAFAATGEIFKAIHGREMDRFREPFENVIEALAKGLLELAEFVNDQGSPR